MEIFRKRIFVIVVLLSLGIILWLFRSRSPEIEIINRVGSTNGTWTACVQMVVYGDHWFVNDARYEVRVERATSRESVLVYSTPASGPTRIAVNWRSEDQLIVEDSLDAMRQAEKNSHSVVIIDYRTR